MVKCKKCGRELDKLDVFPNDLCLECHEVEYDKKSESEKYQEFENYASDLKRVIN